MPVEWTPHRFSGGVLALDVANTVVHRDKPDQRFDRFDEPAEIARFARAVSDFRPGEWNGRTLTVARPAETRPRILAVREAVDALFRDASLSRSIAVPKLEALLRATADGLAEHRGAVAEPDAGGSIPLAVALSLSALALLPEDRWRRIRICPACAWLFADNSRNGSRRWCDMAVCGNRQKARRHYRRKHDGKDGGNA